MLTIRDFATVIAIVVILMGCSSGSDHMASPDPVSDPVQEFTLEAATLINTYLCEWFDSNSAPETRGGHA